VVLSDLAMPDMSGYALVEAISKQPLNATTPAIAYSGYSDRGEQGRGFFAHLTKPVELDRLVKAILDARASVQGAASGEARGPAGPDAGGER
jgi:two-component system CheB/CheR fusion protein